MQLTKTISFDSVIFVENKTVENLWWTKSELWWAKKKSIMCVCHHSHCGQRLSPMMAEVRRTRATLCVCRPHRAQRSLRTTAEARRTRHTCVCRPDCSIAIATAAHQLRASRGGALCAQRLRGPAPAVSLCLRTPSAAHTTFTHAEPSET